MTIYEANKLMYVNIPPITDFNGTNKIVQEYLKKHQSNYYMMLNHDERYFTIFTVKHKNRKCNETASRLSREIISIVRNLGPLKDVVTNENGALEFWVEYNGNITIFVLFDYARGVIEV